MEREDILKEIAKFECQMEGQNNAFLKGLEIYLPSYGKGIIESQDVNVTKIRFDNQIKAFSSSLVSTTFKENIDIQALQTEIKCLTSMLKRHPSAIDIIQHLIDSWSSWDEYEQFYLKELSVSLVRDPKLGTNEEQTLLLQLRKMLSDQDWSNLPHYIEDVYYGRDPQFKDSRQRNTYTQLRNKEVEAYKNSQLEKTTAIIAKIIEAEENIKRKEHLVQSIQSLFKTDFLSADTYYREKNTGNLLSELDYYRMKANYVSSWFDEHMASKKPDTQQLAAIGSCYKNIEVVARAGSGKTATITNRYYFLTQNCHIEPSSILLLAFNRNAAEKMRKDVAKLISPNVKLKHDMPHILTFHALAYSIVHPEEALLYDDESKGTSELSRTIQSIIDRKLRDGFWSSKIKHVMLAHFKGNWEAIITGRHNLSKEEQLDYRRALPNQTLKGEYVKSYGEKRIANLLFEYDIEYKYEKAFRWNDGSPYRPDFTVIAPNNHFIIIEYFGLVGEHDYDAQIQRKRYYWQQQGVQLVEIYPAQIKKDDDAFTENLLDQLTQKGVNGHRLSEEQIWERIKDRAIDEFTGAVKSFISICRKRDFSYDDLENKICNYESSLPTETEFLDIARIIYKEYLEVLTHEKLEDFDGLMSRASLCIKEGITSFDKKENRGDLKNIRHILIDEYQDFSFLFDALLSSIRSLCPTASIFCVGDDWQAINGFAGSDAAFFLQFPNRYNDSHVYHLKTNYRSRQEIVSAGTRLMTGACSGDDIKAFTKGEGLIHVGYINTFQPSLEEKCIHKTDILTPAVLRLVSSILKQNKTVVFLTRTNDRLPVSTNSRTGSNATSIERFLDSVRCFFPENERKRIKASTAHRYKGEQEDAVIILDAINGFYPLIHPTWIFQRVLGDELDKLIEDERRLFYVVVTRAISDLFILTMKGDESPFLKDLGSIKQLIWDEYCPVKAGSLGIRVTVTNQRGFSASPTMSIREQLKQAGYSWDKTARSWNRFYSKEVYRIEDIFSEPWALSANHIIITVYDENDTKTAEYLFIDGNVVQLDGNTRNE